MCLKKEGNRFFVMARSSSKLNAKSRAQPVPSAKERVFSVVPGWCFIRLLMQFIWCMVRLGARHILGIFGVRFLPALNYIVSVSRLICEN